MPRATSVVLAAVATVVLAVGLTGCASRSAAPAGQPSSATAPATPSPPSEPTASPVLADVCLLGDDGSATATAAALTDAGLRVRTSARLPDLLDTRCAMLLSVSATHADAMAAAAAEHPDLPVAAAGLRSDEPPAPNLVRLGADISGAAFVAGYLAAATSASGSVGVLGQADDPGAHAAADAFASGAQHRASQDGRAVRVRGSGPARLVEDPAEAARVLDRWAARGVDVVLLASAGLADVPKPPGVAVVRVGEPGVGEALGWIVADPAATAVAVAQDVADGTFAAGDVTGSLADGGVRLVLGDMPSGRQAQVVALVEQVASGRIAVGPGG